MLNNEQLDLIADVIRPLYQSLEQDVIYDIARRIKKTLTYTRTAELMVMEMEKLGYSPSKIRSEAMKVLRADKEFQKVVEENTLEYKKEVKKLIQKIEKEAERAGNTIVAEAGDMAWIDDMRVWESAGKKLTDNSYLAVLQSAFAEQTAMELKNLTRSTGFKAVSGFESLENAYRRELDKAVLKICTGTFSQEKVLRDVVRELSKSGIRTVDYSSGRTMQIDTAAKLALRTGCHQISVKIHDQNIMNTGENLVYVTEHWGARNEGAGIENHEEWQGKVYFIKPGTDYSEEAKRIKQDRIMDIWYSTGYSPDGTHVNNPLGLHGYNCRHLHMVWFEGSSSLPEKNPRPEPKVINGKKYDYYHMTQKCRSMERGIRALKKEMIARERLGLSTDEIKARISEKTREYRAFCDSCNIPRNTTNLRVDMDVVSISKSKAYQEYAKLQSGALNDKNDPLFIKRNQHAERYYEEIRNRKSSYVVDRLAKNAGLSKGTAQDIYEHVFIKEHMLDGAYKRFDPDYDMAESFRRILEGKNIKPHDIVMLKHEELEQNLMKRYNMIYDEAHEKANQSYNYSEALKEFLKGVSD